MGPGRLGPYGENEIVCGHAPEVLERLPAGCAHAVITSPPYWGLRDYSLPPVIWDGVEGCEHEWGEDQKPGNYNWAEYIQAEGNLDRGHQKKANANRSQFCSLCGAWKGSLGLEPDPFLYVRHIVSVSREVWRVLRPDGSYWIVLGSSYAGSGVHAEYHANPGLSKAGKRGGALATPVSSGFKAKDLVPIPWLVGLALQADGWWLRNDIIWNKPNPMPESASDRCTLSHEYVLLLSKSARYYYDQEAVREPSSEQGGLAANFRRTTKDHVIPKQSVAQHRAERDPTFSTGRRNRRTVWTITTHHYKGAHFATYPPRLVDPCILASTSERGCCPECGTPWERVMEKQSAPIDLLTKRNAPTDGLVHSGFRSGGVMYGSGQKLQDWRNQHPSRTLGWIPHCRCYGVEIPQLIDFPDMPEDAEPPFICERCEGTGLEITLPLMPDLVMPCRRCKGQGERPGNAIWQAWQEEYEQIEANRIQVLRDIELLGRELPTVPPIIVDPFLGAGTTALEALRYRRVFLGIDLSGRYCEMAKRRVAKVQMRLL